MAKTFQDIMADARKEIPEVTAQQVSDLLKNNGKSPVILDVREKTNGGKATWTAPFLCHADFSRSKSKILFPIKTSPLLPTVPVAFVPSWPQRLCASSATKTCRPWRADTTRGNMPGINGFRIFSLILI